jgi:protein involved in sex pheromone biosynthesis
MKIILPLALLALMTSCASTVSKVDESTAQVQDASSSPDRAIASEEQVQERWFDHKK